MNWFILEAVQNSRILSVGATPVLLFTSCLTPFVELLNGATQASRSLVNFQFTRSMKNLTSAFWYSIANVPMGIIAVATTPFDKGRRARDSYPDSMRPVDARSPTHLSTEVTDKAAIERELKREADLKEQVETLRGFLTKKQKTKLDRLLGYEAQFAKALEFIDIRIKELEAAADPDKLQGARNEIYQEAINSLWNLLTEPQQIEVTTRSSAILKAKYELVIQTIATQCIELNRNINNTINLIATLAGINTIPLESTPDQRMALINKLVQKLSEAEKNEFKTLKEFPNQIQYLFEKFSAAAIKKAGEQALIDDNVVTLRKEFAENLELLTQTTENLDKTQKALDAQKQLVQEKEQKVLELTQNYDAAKTKLEEFQQGLPQETHELITKIQKLEQQHTSALNGLKFEHEKAIEKLKQTINEKQEVINQTGNKNLEFTTTIENQKKQIFALEKEHAEKIDQLNLAHKNALEKTATDKETELTQLHDLRIQELTREHQAAQEKAVNELTNQIAQLNQNYQTIEKNNTALQQELEESKKAVAQSKERALQLLNENKQKLLEIETLKKQLEEVKKVTEENQVSNNLSLPTPSIPPASTTERKLEEVEFIAASKGSVDPRPTTPPGADVVKELAATTGISTPPETAQKVPLEAMVSTLLSNLLKRFKELKSHKIGRAVDNKMGYTLTADLQKTVQDTFQKLDMNEPEFKAVSDKWNEILKVRTARQIQKNSPFEVAQKTWDEFVSDIQKIQPA